MIACNSDEELNIDYSSNESKEIEVVNGILKFQDQAVYDSIANKLACMNIEERNIFYKNIGFEPIANLLSKADDELEYISNLQSLEEFEPQYSAFKERYKDVFIFNDQDEEDLSPYTAYSSLRQELVVNQEGFFYIGNEKIVADKYSTFSDKMEESNFIALRSASNYNEENHAWSHTSSRKVGLYIRMDKSVTNTTYGHPIDITFTSQKKGVFGWVRYKTIYYAYFYLTFPAGYRYTFMGSYSNGYYSSGGEKDGNYTFTLAYAWAVWGSMECWSRGVEESVRGKAEVYLDGRK